MHIGIMNTDQQTTITFKLYKNQLVKKILNILYNIVSLNQIIVIEPDSI